MPNNLFFSCIFIFVLHYIVSVFRKENHNSEDEDYSLSLSAVLHRRASSRKKGARRPSTSSQMAGNAINVAKIDRRRSSVYTTSSGE